MGLIARFRAAATFWADFAMAWSHFSHTIVPDRDVIGNHRSEYVRSIIAVPAMQQRQAGTAPKIGHCIALHSNRRFPYIMDHWLATS